VNLNCSVDGERIIDYNAERDDSERKNILRRQRQGIDIATADDTKIKEEAREAGKPIDKSLLKYPGRKIIDMPKDFAGIYKSWNDGNISARRAMQSLGVSKGTFYKFIDAYEAENNLPPQPKTHVIKSSKEILTAFTIPDIVSYDSLTAFSILDTTSDDFYNPL